MKNRHVAVLAGRLPELLLWNRFPRNTTDLEEAIPRVWDSSVPSMLNECVDVGRGDERVKKGLAEVRQLIGREVKDCEKRYYRAIGNLAMSLAAGKATAVAPFSDKTVKRLNAQFERVATAQLLFRHYFVLGLPETCLTEEHLRNAALDVSNRFHLSRLAELRDKNGCVQRIASKGALSQLGVPLDPRFIEFTRTAFAQPGEPAESSDTPQSGKDLVGTAGEPPVDAVVETDFYPKVEMFRNLELTLNRLECGLDEIRQRERNRDVEDVPAPVESR